MPALYRWQVPLAGAAAALTVGSGVGAYASWKVTATSPTFTVHAAQLPRVPRPLAEVTRTGLRIRWTPVEPASRYVVTRHAGGRSAVACTVAAGLRTCVDPRAPKGYPVSYTVAAAYGRHWVGPPSEPSTPVPLPLPGRTAATSAAGGAPQAPPPLPSALAIESPATTSAPTPSPSGSSASPPAPPPAETRGAGPVRDPDRRNRDLNNFLSSRNPVNKQPIRQRRAFVTIAVTDGLFVVRQNLGSEA